MIKTNDKATYALRPQKKVGTFDFPFTLNLFIGCLMQCVYCFVPVVLKKPRHDFFSDVEVRTNMLAILKKELIKYSSLPQHLKRVQIGVTMELFQPQVINYMKNTLGFDLIKDMLDLFKEEWDKGNKWMLHILTKNHNIINYLPILKDMKEMVQVEFSMIHYDDSISRKYEKFTSSIPKRLDAISQLSKDKIFVRVMAMPFYGNQNDLLILKNMVFNSGAQAFKNKALNYYGWDQLSGIYALDPLSKPKTKTNIHVPSFLIKSGEEIVPQSVEHVEMPKRRKKKEDFINWSIKKEGLESRDIVIVDMGYSSINNVDWGYLK